jgi:U6 snRNA-associated Sm-like protein LSm7
MQRTAINQVSKESIIKLDHLIDKSVHVKFLGGREVIGKLKSADPSMNLILDDAKEVKKSSDWPEATRELPRTLGVVVLRGTQVKKK